MIEIAASTAVVYQRILIDIAMYFGLFVIVAMALNFQYGNAGVPNMGCAVSASIGGYTVSALITRIIYWVGTNANIGMKPYATG
jgi:ABC-type branched-subunit amino acid transport system permease subunit